MNKKVSVIIPARNEEKFIKRTLESLKNTAVFPLEIIVVVNGSRDRTFEIARYYTKKVLNFTKALGPSAARNEGAKVASGDIFVFLDADTEISGNVIARIKDSFSDDIIGVCSATGKKTDKKLRAKIFFAFKNFIHKTSIYRGSIALLFCSKKVFTRARGFDKDMWIGELGDFIKRCVKSGAEYKFLQDCHVNTSMRRYEKKWGFAKSMFFWTGWRLFSLVKAEKILVKKYFNIKQ